jgi:solute carrier family 25 carnitine/acylcarnitine transporter 20/29
MIGKYKYSSVFDCAQKSYKNEGLKVFTRGLLPTILRAYPANAATFTTVSLVNNYFKNMQS